MEIAICNDSGIALADEEHGPTKPSFQTYFIRINSKVLIAEETRDYLWNESLIAIHYPWNKSQLVGNFSQADCESIEPDDYTGSARTAMWILKDLADNGGYVCCKHTRPLFMIGFVPPKSQIKLVEGRWSFNKNRPAMLKTLPLTKMAIVPWKTGLSLREGVPKEGSICHWRNGIPKVRNLVENLKSNPVLKSLTRQQEIMCSEALRLEPPDGSLLPRLAHLIRRIGGTMPIVDIYGIATDGTIIAAQVTLATDGPLESKRLALKSCGLEPANHLILFCPTDKEEMKDGILMVPIQEVFNRFTATPLGQLWLRESA
jgi:hypothetical protein